MVREMPALIKHVGRGARLAKALSRDEARDAMSFIADGKADDYQIGAFLIAMRMKGETADELAGFVDALGPHASLRVAADIDIDLHADGREGRPSVSLPAACVAASLGVRVLIRGMFQNRFAKNDPGATFATLRLHSTSEVTLAELGDYAPRIFELIRLREKLGVRTCMNSAVKLLDPARTRRPVIGIFHGPYHEPIAGAAKLLGATRAVVVQAPGGVPELQPDKPTKVSLVYESDENIALTTINGEPSGVMPTADSATQAAALILQVLSSPADASAWIIRATIASASLFLWAAGHGAHPMAHLEAARETLLSGRAGAVLAAMRS